MYASHITDPENVLPFNRNNCRGGSEENCMYYNEDDGAHYNYTSVQGTGDPQSPYYRCHNMAMDTYNQEQLYGDHAIGGLGGYNATDPYGEVNNRKGFYGGMDESYPAKPTCSGYVNTNAVPDDGQQDYDWWDRYHKYHHGHMVDSSMPMGIGVSYYDNAKYWILMAFLAVVLYYYRNKLGGTRNTAIAIAVMLGLFFFFK